MTNNISDKDQKDWKNFLEKNEKLTNKDLEKEEVKSHITKSLDLHGYTLDEANKKVENFITDCFDQKVSKVKVANHSNLFTGFRSGTGLLETEPFRFVPFKILQAPRSQPTRPPLTAAVRVHIKFGLHCLVLKDYFRCCFVWAALIRSGKRFWSKQVQVVVRQAVKTPVCCALNLNTSHLF